MEINDIQITTDRERMLDQRRGRGNQTKGGFSLSVSLRNSTLFHSQFQMVQEEENVNILFAKMLTSI